ncbi:hypothetical protein RRG08_034214 [Elysia crispata]|uniref:Uncharacterized protein n=1 Tax=Elysia crispata TaxID=231223 RepID=A0AAE1DQ42_9GAST|nr:hypothetical protein RRG08_034214 [Elysia crispata]
MRPQLSFKGCIVRLESIDVDAGQKLTLVVGTKQCTVLEGVGHRHLGSVAWAEIRRVPFSKSVERVTRKPAVPNLKSD